MILSDIEITYQQSHGNIVITPFDKDCLGPNSYDVHLGNTLYAYGTSVTLFDCKEEPPPHMEVALGQEGFVLSPGRLYLASTVEYTETHGYVPFLEGKSSLGRMGLGIHVTAGRGDDGFCGHWTLELTCVLPIIIYPGMPIGQLIYHTMQGRSRQGYGKREVSKYANQGSLPQVSKMHKNFK